jgi:hypothetical protein
MLQDVHFQLARFESCGILSSHLDFSFSPLFCFFAFCFFFCFFFLVLWFFVFFLFVFLNIFLEGNGAIFTENAGYNASGIISSVELYNVGFSWNDNYKYPYTLFLVISSIQNNEFIFMKNRIASRKKDYAVEVGSFNQDSSPMNQFSYYQPGFWLFKPGILFSFYCYYILIILLYYYFI